MVDDPTNIIPCKIYENFSACNLSNWDTLVIELCAGITFALIFFYIQHKNTEKINKMFQKQFDYIVKDSITKIHWIQNGLANIQTHITENKLEQAKNILDLNSKIFVEMEKILEKHKDIAPELVESVRKLSEFNRSLIISKNPDEVNNNDEIIKKMTSIVNEQAKNYGIKKFGISPHKEYIVTLSEKTRFRLNIPSFQLPITIIVAIITITQLFSSFGIFTFDTSIDTIMFTTMLVTVSVITITVGFRFRFRIIPVLTITAIVIPIMFGVLIFGFNKETTFISITDTVFFIIASVIVAFFLRIGFRLFLFR